MFNKTNQQENISQSFSKNSGSSYNKELLNEINKKKTIGELNDGDFIVIDETVVVEPNSLK